MATGCEEAGTVGMLRFVRSHRPAFDRKLTVFVNFDNLGAGRPAAITAEGILLPLRSDRASLTAARAFADAHPELGISLRPYHILTTDAVIPLTLGYRAMSIMAFDARGNLPNWHWHTDTVDRVDAQTLASAAALGLAVTRAALADRGD